MEKLNKDAIVLIALELDYLEILNLCFTSKKFNKHICLNKFFWMNKIKKDYPKISDNIFNNKHKINNWKELYIRIYRVKNGTAKFLKFNMSKSLTGEIMKQYTPKWSNPSGLLPNDMNGWTLRKDKSNSNIVYLYPSTYYTIPTRQKPKNGENHPTIMLKITFPNIKIEEVKWDESVLGDRLHYRRGDGIVNWFDDIYTYKMQYNGMNNIFSIFIYSYI